MNNFFETIKKQLQVWGKEHAARMEAKRKAQLDAEARKAVQVMEYGGNLFVSVHGIPLFGVNDINGKLTDVVANGRKVYKVWKEEKIWKR